MRDFNEIKVWKKAHEFVITVYNITENFPRREVFSLTSQLRRAALSIPTNIAEGCGRVGDKEMAHFLNIASGSSSETEYLLILSKDIGYLSAETFTVLHLKIIEIRKMLHSFIAHLRKKS